jgi:hypothetical protein
MSNPQEKAKELIDKYKPICGGYWGGNINKQFAKQSALIAVDEMLDYRNALFINEGSLAHQYLLQVKEEINKL